MRHIPEAVSMPRMHSWRLANKAATSVERIPRQMAEAADPKYTAFCGIDAHRPSGICNDTFKWISMEEHQVDQPANMAVHFRPCYGFEECGSLDVAAICSGILRSAKRSQHSTGEIIPEYQPPAVLILCQVYDHQEDQLIL